MFRELCGDKTLKNVVLVTNMWTRDPLDINEAREIKLSSKFFRPVLDKGAQLIRHYDTTKSTHDIIRKIVVNQPTVLQIQQELVDEHRDIVDTSAGQAVNRELNEQAKQHRAELEKLEKRIMQALREKDEEMRRELEKQARGLRERMTKIAKQLEGMALNYMAEKKRVEARMKEIEQELREERERAEGECKRQLADLDRRLRDAGNASVADRARLEEITRHQAKLKVRDEEKVRRLQEQIERIKTDSERMASNYIAEKERMEAKMNKMNLGTKERERAKAEYDQQLTKLNRRLRDTANASAADRARLEQEIKGLRNRDTPSSQMPPHPTPYVQAVLYLDTHDS